MNKIHALCSKMVKIRLHIVKYAKWNNIALIIPVFKQLSFVLLALLM